MLRRAIPEDAANLAALAIQVWLYTYARDGIRSAISEYVLSEFTPEKFSRLISDRGHSLLVAEINNHLVGYVTLKYGSPCPSDAQVQTEVATLYVQEHFARRGIGSALLSICATVARDRTGDSALWLTVNCRNADAIAFYRKHRFVQVGSTDFLLGTERHENQVLMRRDG